MRTARYLMLVLMTVVISAAETSHADLSQGLVARYLFDGNAKDASGNGHDGTSYGAYPVYDRNGNPDSAFRFDGSSYVLVPNADAFNVGNLTISLWISFLSGPYCTDDMRPMSFVSKSAVDPYDSNTGYIFPYIGFGDCNSFGLIVNTAGIPYDWDFSRSYSFTSIPDPGQWHLYTATYDGSVRRVYIDCNLVAADPTSPTGDIKPNNNDLYIGVQAGTQEYAKADMDDVRIYGRALGDAQVQELCAEAAKVQAQVVINPLTLNLTSSGKWITAYIQLPAGFQASDIDIASIVLSIAGAAPSQTIKATGPSQVADENGGGVNELMVKFDRQKLSSALSDGTVTLRVSGKLVQGRAFEGTAAITVIH